jgi:hypothetical protein
MYGSFCEEWMFSEGVVVNVVVVGGALVVGSGIAV